MNWCPLARIVQLVECWIHSPCVVGLNPSHQGNPVMPLLPFLCDHEKSWS